MVVATSTLVVYEPLDGFKDKTYYWQQYIEFYEQYWGGPTSPYGVWFGNEYQAFRDALANFLDMDEKEVEDCFFMKDKEGKYYLAPLATNSNMLASYNTIPIHWFVPFRESDRKSLYTHWGFNAIHYDTRIGTALENFKKATEIIEKYLSRADSGQADKVLSSTLNTLKNDIHTTVMWLSGFNATGFLLLNYGDLCSVIHPLTLKNEQSVQQIQNFLGYLDSNHIEQAQSELNVVMQKWEDIRMKASGEISRDTLQ